MNYAGDLGGSKAKELLERYDVEAGGMVERTVVVHIVASMKSKKTFPLR